MSLSRLPQVALRRLVPAITAMPKSLDDEQLKKMMEPHQQLLLLGGASLKALLAARPELASFAQPPPPGAVAALAKSASSDFMQPAVGRLMATLNSSAALPLHDLALPSVSSVPVSASASAQPLLLMPSEPASPASEPLPISQELSAAAPPLDAESVEALVTALRGTVAISRDSSEAASEDEHLPPIPADLSSAERRKEQNRRAQKKFRQKDKVRQKEVKWRASQYDALVESNKRFKRDIDDVTRERDMYRRILQSHGIAIDPAEAVAALRRPALGPAAPSPSSPAATTATAVESPAEPALPLGGMDQIAQDTFGALPQPQFMHATVAMNEILAPLMYAAVKADPMFGAPMAQSASAQTLVDASYPGTTTATTTTTAAAWLGAASASDSSLLFEPPMLVDDANIDPEYVRQGSLDARFVDPTAFIDELLSSPSLPSSFATPSPMALQSRKRSFDDALM